MTTQNEKTVEAKAEVMDESPKADKTAQACSSVVDALFDVGTAWVEVGLGYGKAALENSATALARTAKALETIQKSLRTDAGAGDGAQPHA